MIYDTLHTLPVSPDLEFVPVAAATDLQLPVVAAAAVLFENADDKAYFAPGDNVLLDSVECSIPFGFGQGTGLHFLAIVWVNQLGTHIPIPELANSQVSIPDMCGLKFGAGGLFIKAPRASQGTKFALALVNPELNVSMIGVPDILVTAADPIIVTYWLELRHTLDLGT